MNNSKKIITIVIAILILLGLLAAGKVLLDKKSGEQDQTGNQMQKQNDSKKETTISGIIFDLIKGGNTVKCTYSSNDAAMQVSGTSYVSGKKMRSDSEIISDKTKMESHMISDGEWVYTWSSAMPQGMKMKLDTVEDVDTNTTVGNENQQESIKNFQDQFDFKCTGWGVDNSVFELPKNIEFVDFSETMKNYTNPSGGNSSMCAACSYAQDEKSKLECKAQFNCK